MSLLMKLINIISRIIHSLSVPPSMKSTLKCCNNEQTFRLLHSNQQKNPWNASRRMLFVSWSWKEFPFVLVVIRAISGSRFGSSLLLFILETRKWKFIPFAYLGIQAFAALCCAIGGYEWNPMSEWREKKHSKAIELEREASQMCSMEA